MAASGNSTSSSILVSYDWLANGWQPIPHGASNMVFVVRVDLELPGPNRSKSDDEHICVEDGGEGCTVCDECCQPYLDTQHDCDACFNATCAAAPAGEDDFACESRGTADEPALCSAKCVSSCWTSLLSAPCMSECTTNAKALLVAVLIPYFARLVLDFLAERLPLREPKTHIEAGGCPEFPFATTMAKAWQSLDKVSVV